MFFRAIALDETDLAPSRKRSAWSAVIAGALILHAALVLSESLQGVAWLAWVECVMASLVGLARLRESGGGSDAPDGNASAPVGAAVGSGSMAASPQSVPRPRA